MVDLKEIFGSSILIVDDNPINIALLEDILDEEGYDNYVSTVDPREVPILYAREHFDLMLLDVRMPHMTGIELMHLLAEQTKDDYLPILVLTAQTDQKTKQEALAAGAKDFLTKPFDRWEVVLRIRNMLETRFFYKRQIFRGDILEKEVRERTKIIRETQLEIIRRVGRVGEFRDNETGAHVIRMSKMSVIIARKMGLAEETCENILYASPMHDVGKIAIPDAILLKNGKLTDEEWEIMKTHASVGGDILGDHPSDVMLMAQQMALNHHEKWDGSGYPNGLAGEAIPLPARIAAITDVFDALTSKRPYKEAWAEEQAVEYIREHSGKHFDPKIVEAFLNSLHEILFIKRNFPDD